MTATGIRFGAFEAEAWAGIVVALDGCRGAAIRLSVECGSRRVAAPDLLHLVHEVGPHAPDGAYARVSFDLTDAAVDSMSTSSAKTPPRPIARGEASLTWEWARANPHTIVAAIETRRAMRVWLEGTVPWDWAPRWRPATDGLRAGIGGAAPSVDPVDVSCEVSLRIVSPAPGDVEADSSAGTARCAIDLAPGDRCRLWLRVAAPDADDCGPDERAIDDALTRGRLAYEASRVAATGAWCGLTDSIANTLHWMVLLQPESGRRYVPAGRRWLFPSPDGGRDHWTIFEWDGFLNALLLSLESPDLAREMLDAVVATQYPSGNVPNWRGRFAGTPDRSQPPIGAFVVVKLLLRLDDVALVEHVLPALEAWHAWWRRRRRPSGLYAWGSDVSAVPDWVPPWERAATHRQKAAWESGQDDLPNWDDVPWDEVGQTLDMDCVDLSALVALDAECLSFLAERVGRIDQAQRYRSEHAALCARLDERLWDESRGVYADRFPDGRFSSRLAASNFLPLLAGAVPDHRLSRVLDLLTDPNQFWGRWIVPTIGRRDPAFQDQQYWRGTIWPPTNFLLYEGLRRVRADDAAATLAERSVALFLDDWRCHQVSRENFSSIDGIGGGHRHQSWGPLFSWTGLSELVDATPWDGLRVGAVSMARESSVTRLRLGGHVWDVTLGPSRTVVRCDGIVELMADAPVCLRHWQNADRGWQARLSTSRPTVVSVRGDEPRLYPAGNHDVEARQVE